MAVALAYSDGCKDIIQDINLCSLPDCFEFNSEQLQGFQNYGVALLFLTLVCLVPFCSQTHLFSKDSPLGGGPGLH